jgi:hypothetical protein
MDFSFADDLHGVASSIGSIPGDSADETPRPELQLALDGHKSTHNAMEMMQQYFEQTSGPPSPRQGKPKHRWFSAPPRFQIYDEEVMNVFVNITKYHLLKTFPILDDFLDAENSSKALHLAYAAVGGLFCNIPGRFKVVNSMYNDARRMLLDPVTISCHVSFSYWLTRYRHIKTAPEAQMTSLVQSKLWVHLCNCILRGNAWSRIFLIPS